MALRLIFYYIYWSIRLRIPPWYYFQINAEYFNAEKGFYSKIDIDQRIPKKWRLQQSYLDKNNPPRHFPVFLKPEWGQNSNGIIRADCLADFLQFDQAKSKIPYIVQAAAQQIQEYEIFYIRSPDNINKNMTLTITKSVNRSDERYPINNINNKDMIYQDCTRDFTDDDIQQLHKHLRQLPPFRIARIGLKANTKADLLAGLFHIIEINLFAPFPINLLDKNLRKKDRQKFIKESMYKLVMVSKTTPKKHFNRFVFFKKTLKHYQSKSDL